MPFLAALALGPCTFPSGNVISIATQYPTSSWLPEYVGALLAEGTKLKYIVYIRAHRVSTRPALRYELFYASVSLGPRNGVRTVVL